MKLTNFFHLGITIMARKKIKAGKKPVKDHMRIHLIQTKTDQQTSVERKETAQKILAIMFSLSFKRGRPSTKDEELSYAV